MERQLESLPRAKIAGASWRDNGAIILCPSLEAAHSARRSAGAGASRDHGAMTPRRSATKSSNAGAIFLGPHTPEAIGDYVGGSNHVLPTARSARFSSGLGVLDFMKRTSLLKCDARSLEALGPAAIALGASGGARGARTLGRVAASREQPMSAKPAKSRNRLAEVDPGRSDDSARLSRCRSRADGRDLRPDRGKFLRRSGSRRWPLRAQDLAGGIEADLRGQNREGRDRGHDRGVDDAVPAAAQGLFPCLRDLLFGDPRPRARARSRRSTASARSCTMKAPSSWPSG